MRQTKRLYSVIFSLAVLSVAAGVALLSLRFSAAGFAGSMAPLAVMVAGVFVLYRSLTGARGKRTLFSGLVLTMVASIRFLAVLAGASTARYWPLYAVALGVCVLVAPLLARQRLMPKTIVIASSFMLMGMFLSIFSFGFSSVRFRVFIAMWWPALFIASGLLLLVVWSLRNAFLSAQRAGAAELPVREPSGAGTSSPADATDPHYQAAPGAGDGASTRTGSATGDGDRGSA